MYTFKVATAHSNKAIGWKNWNLIPNRGNFPKVNRKNFYSQLSMNKFSSFLSNFPT